MKVTTKTDIKEFPLLNRGKVRDIYDIDDSTLLIVTTEFLPRDEVLDWAAALIDKPEYRDRKVIFMTHAFLHERSAKRIEKNSYELTPGNTGAEIWRKLIEPSPNIRMIVCGHTGKPGDYEDAVAYRVDKTARDMTSTR